MWKTVSEMFLRLWQGQKKKLRIFWLRRKKVIIIYGIAIIMIIASIITINIAMKKPEQPEVEPVEEPKVVTTIITKASLEKIIKVNQLSTFIAYYNGIATVMNAEKPENIDYHVSYEAVVKAGINTDQIEIAIDNTIKSVSITIPDVVITEVIVDINSLDYMFVNDKVNNVITTEQAYKQCEADVKKESVRQESIYTLAEENAINTVTAMVYPILNQLDDNYSLIVK